MGPIPSTPALRILCCPPLTDSLRSVLADAAVRLVDVEDADDLVKRVNRHEADLAFVATEEWNDSPGLRRLGADIAVVLQSGAATATEAWLTSLEQGAQDVLSAEDWARPGLLFRLNAAVVRHRLANDARMAYATDLATGLPHQQQLLEHMSHLLALREREPAPMALLVLRIEGLATTQASLGAEAASALRRKLAVRLRSGLRASDVVASIGSDSFAVLLAWIDAASDVDGVAAKLMQSVQRPFTLAGQPVALSVSVGMGRYPEDGKDSASLLQRAVAEAAGIPGQGRSGFANFAERGAPSAANDDAA